MIRSLRLLVIASALLVSLPASANFVCNQRIVSVGDGAAKLVQNCGNPDMKEKTETKFGGDNGHLWTYFRGSKTVVVRIVEGRVTEIKEFN